MHQHHAAAVGRATGLDIHVTHLQGLALGLEGEMFDRVGIVETLQLRPIGRAFGGLGQHRQRRGEEQAAENKGA